MVELKTVKIEPKECQIILGQAHFIKSVEDKKYAVDSPVTEAIIKPSDEINISSIEVLQLLLSN
jgi:adenosine/AMP kinase